MNRHDINYYLAENNNTLCPADISLGDIANSEWWQFLKPLWDDMLWLYYGDRVVFFNRRFPDNDDITAINNILRSWVIMLKSKAHNYERLYNLYMQDYNPLWNVDGVTGTVAQDDHTGTDTRKKTGSDTLRQTGTDTRAATGTDSTDIVTSDELVKSGNETMQASGDDVNTKQVATFDSGDNWVNSEKDTVHNGKLDTHTYNNVTDARDMETSHDTTYGRTDTNTKNLTDTQEYNTTDQDTKNLTDKHVDMVIRQGNIGVVSSQKMWTEEVELWRDNMSEWAKQIIKEAVNLVTYAVEGVL